MPNSIRLYRYMSAEAALKTIESRSFKAGRLHELNDPFEWRMGVTGIVPEGELFAQSLMDSFVDEMGRDMGVLCFSDTPNESVLWSHYANNHHGVTFEVDHVIEPDHLFKMNYTDDRPVVDANRLHVPTELDCYLKPLIW